MLKPLSIKDFDLENKITKRSRFEQDEQFSVSVLLLCLTGTFLSETIAK